MHKRKLLYAVVLPLLLLFSASAFAQDRVISGRVTDSSGRGVSGASVSVKGQNSRGTTTGENGNFSLSVPSSATTLVFSSVGYGAQEVSIAGRSSVNVTMQATAGSLNEIVVVGYGTTRKKDLTGSVATVTAKDFQKGNITTPEQLIAGKVPGVSIVSNGGQPGSGSKIRIRGGSSLSASNDPLIVIDGVPLDPDGINGASNPLSFINANDIESFTVLKDASAAAIYGTRAANGVILITTKKGRSGGPLRVNFNTVNSVSHITKEVPILTADQVRAIVNANGTAAQKAQLGTATTDWQKQIYQTALSTDNNLTLSGGIKNLPYRVTLGYQYQNGILKTDHLQKTSLALVFNPTFFDNHLRVDINLKGSMEQTRFANQGAIGTAVSYDPTQPVTSKSNRFGGYYEWLDATGLPALNTASNPVGLLEETFDRQKPMRSIGNAQFDYKFHFLPDLHANLNLGYDISKNTGTYYIPDSAASGYRTGGSKNPGKQTKQATVLDFYLNYVKDIKSIKSRVDVTAGYSYNDYQTTNYNFRGYKANGDTFPATTPPTFLFDKPEHFLVSFFGRFNYSFNDKYLLTGTIRRDGSSRFGPSNKWGTFPSIAFAWRVKQESFLKESKGISDLKLRLGYGITGQQEGIGNYGFLSSYSLSSTYASYYFGNMPYQAYSPSGFNAGLKWEQTATYNAGLDYGFLDNRITGTLDFYLKKTSGLLNYVAQPAGTNFSAYILSNVGSMDNKGVEFSINAQPIRQRDMSLDLNFNITYNRNTIKNLTVVPNDPNYIGLLSGNAAGANGFLLISAVGGAKNTFYLYKQVYDAAGKPIEGLFEDKNRDGIINDLDRYKSKSVDPNVFLGFSPNFNYKKWNVGAVLRASFNNYVYNNVYSNLGKLTQIQGTYTTANGSVNYLETGFKGGTDLQPLSDYYLENASFLRMDNVNIGYNVGRISHGKATLRLTGTVQNVFVVTKYKGLDPEVGSGIDNNIYPRPRIYSMGANLDF